MPTDQRDRPINPHGQADADRLLNEVFRDVDQMLDRSQELPQEPANHKPIALKPLQVPPIVVQPLVAPAMQPPAVESASVEVAINSQGKRAEDKSLLWFDRLLLGGAFVSLAVVLGLWLFNRGYFSQWFGGDSTPTETSSSPAAPVSNNSGRAADQDFIAYMGQALDRIENRQALPDTLEPPVPISPTETGTLQIPVDGTSPDAVAQSLTRIANALERVSTTPVPLPDLASGDASVADSDADEDEAVVQPPEIPPVLREIPPAPSSAATATPSPAEKEPDPSPQPPREQRTAAAPAGIYALVGTLERGEGQRPAALFEVNGSPRWIDIGQPVGDSGWTLTEVTGDRVSMRRNGETRTIYVGQQF
ncbi:hypothetical protein E1H12_21520 [Geitlerinema sp. P-1104]|uniref:hypothetical protein n=1 Tax=Geitlerinema sp. P-1104 TaxID=2546230 RepID=UPI001476DD71|nr:hypothetical protein [Geitlerinema sp. P-1104]NMG61018.1 hypothetical protein [Geitlerinema sp. P-1104]